MRKRTLDDTQKRHPRGWKRKRAGRMRSGDLYVDSKGREAGRVDGHRSISLTVSEAWLLDLSNWVKTQVIFARIGCAIMDPGVFAALAIMSAAGVMDEKDSMIVRKVWEENKTLSFADES